MLFRLYFSLSPACNVTEQNHYWKVCECACSSSAISQSAHIGYIHITVASVCLSFCLSVGLSILSVYLPCCLSVCCSVCLSIYHSVSLFFCRFVFLCSVCLSVYHSVCLSVCLWCCLSVCHPVCWSVLSVCLSIILSACLLLCLFVQSVCLSFSLLSACLSFCLLVCRSLYCSICLSVYHSFYLSSCLSVVLSVCLHCCICFSIYHSVVLSLSYLFFIYFFYCKYVLCYLNLNSVEGNKQLTWLVMLMDRFSRYCRPSWLLPTEEAHNMISRISFWTDPGLHLTGPLLSHCQVLVDVM